MRKPVTLMAGKFGSRHFGTKPFLGEALKRTGKDKPLVMYVGAASGDNRAFGTALCAIVKLSGAHKVVWPKLAGKKKETAKAKEALASADLVFVGGGDVEEGIKHLAEAGLNEDFKAAADRGAVFTAMSAGAIMLGERWIRWPHEQATDDDAETYPCLGIVPVSLDTHGEGDGWAETHAFAAVRARETKQKACAYGIPSGGALLIGSDGKARALGVPAPVFVAEPGQKARIKKTLEVTE